MAAVKGLHATIVLRDQGQQSNIQDEAALDIVTPEGWGFRARIWHDREATLLNGIIHDQVPVPKAFEGPLDALLPVFLKRPGASEKPVKGRLTVFVEDIFSNTAVPRCSLRFMCRQFVS